MTEQIETFLSKIHEQQNAERIWSAACHFFEDFGFTGVLRGERNPGTKLQKSDTQMSSSLSGWQSSYFAEGDDSRDPLFSDYALPPVFATGSEFLCDYPYLQAEDRAVIQRAADFGLISGMALKLPGQRQEANRGWHLLSDLPRKELSRIQLQNASLFLVCASLADEKICADKKSTNFRLTQREAECFSWLATGLRTDQIADKLGIRPVTVDMHIRNARERLGARTREQALAIALSANLITL